MNNLVPVSRMGISPKWMRRKSVIRATEKSTPRSMSNAIAYNSWDPSYGSWAPPDSSYIGVGSPSLRKAVALALRGLPWEQAAIGALGYITFAKKLDFFSHFQFRILFPDHPQPMRMMDWETTTVAMAYSLLLGQEADAIYLGYLTYASLNRKYQLVLSYEEEHRRVHALMLRLFAAWRGDASHNWPSYAYDEPIYEGIVAKWRDPDPEALAPWLLAACDRHTHQAQLERSETKFYDCSRFPCDPVEILFVLKLRELEGLQNPVLDHPLMAPPFDKLPVPQSPFVPDKLMEGTLARLHKDWPNYEQVVSLDALKASAHPAAELDSSNKPKS